MKFNETENYLIKELNKPDSDTGKAPDIYGSFEPETTKINMNGVERITAERERQINKEGFTLEHDDLNKNGELAMAAVCYALVPSKEDPEGALMLPKDEWPETWDKKWWKPCLGNRIRELEKAGALIAAEIDRLLRLEE